MLGSLASKRARLRSAEPLLLRRLRGERAIAIGRVLLAAVAWLPLSLDPPAPGPGAALATTVVAVFLVYAAGLAAATWSTRVLPRWIGPASHVLDLVSFSLLNLLTAGPSSPFFPFFVFALVAAAIRWRWRGTLWTAAGALAVYGAMGISSGMILHDPAFKLDHFIVRTIHLAVLSLLLAYFSAHHARLERDLSLLADWPRSVPTSRRRLVRGALQRAAEILGVERMVMVWEEPGEPGLPLVIWEARSALRWRTLPQGRARPRAAGPLAGRPFFCISEGGETVAFYEEAGRLSRWQGAPLEPGLAEHIAFTTAIGLPLAGESLQGLLIACDRRDPSADDLTTSRIVARIVASQMDQLSLSYTIERAAAVQERLRVARDLHDGLAQSLAGIALKVASAAREIETRPQDAGRRLEEVQQLLVAEQRELREFIQQARTALRAPRRAVCARIQGLVERIETTWGLPVTVRLSPALDGSLSEDLETHVCGIVQEALSNTARHAGATHAEVTLECGPHGLRIAVSDDGQGFPFLGNRDLATLEAAGEGPWAIRQRVAALGGSLSVESSRSGATIEVHLPPPAPES